MSWNRRTPLRIPPLLPALAATAWVLLAFGCAVVPEIHTRREVQFPERPPPRAANAFPHRPLPPAESEALLARARIEVRSTRHAGAGLTGATREVLYFPESDRELTVKWKEAAPPSLDGINNSPRKELAAYQLQRLFLDPADYPIPVSVIRCAPIEPYRELFPAAKANVDAPCVLGVLSIWLSDVTLPEKLLDKERFERDYVYAYFLSNFNLATHLIDHKDGRRGNFLVAKDDSRRQVFAVDNGVSHHGPFYNWFVKNWNDLRIPAIRKESVDRLQALEREDLDYLGVLAQLEADSSGVLRDANRDPAWDEDRGVRKRPGMLQFGLTRREIDDIYERIEELVEDVNEGDFPVF